MILGFPRKSHTYPRKTASKPMILGHSSPLRQSPERTYGPNCPNSEHKTGHFALGYLDSLFLTFFPKPHCFWLCVTHSLVGMQFALNIHHTKIKDKGDPCPCNP